MRASRQPGSLRSTARTFAITGSSSIAGSSRSLRPRAISSSSSALCRGHMAGLVCVAGAAASIANTSLVATAMPGLTSTANSRGNSSGSERISPVPRMNRGRGSRHTGTSAPVARAACARRASSGARRFARASSRKAAAASAEPPPSPAATGKRFESAKRPSLRASTRSASARAALSTRLSATSPAAAAVGPATLSAKASPGVKVKASPTPAKATRLSISCRPSARRPTTRSVRLTLAGAFSRTQLAPRGLAAAWLLVFGLGSRRCVVGKPGFQLGLDLVEIFRLGLEVARVRPLEARLEHASHSPVRIAEVIVDGGILGFELDGALELLDRLLHVAKPVVGPTQGVDDIAIIRALLDRALDHAHTLVEIDALVDPRIAEVIEDVRLVRKELQRLLEIGLGLRPLLGALEADASEIVDHPVRLLGLADSVDAL